jgi:hypothetical protein
MQYLSRLGFIDGLIKKILKFEVLKIIANIFFLIATFGLIFLLIHVLIQGEALYYLNLFLNYVCSLFLNHAHAETLEEYTARFPRVKLDVTVGHIPVKLFVEGDLVKEMYSQKGSVYTYAKTAAITLAIMSQPFACQANDIFRTTSGVLKIKK